VYQVGKETKYATV